MNEHVENRQPLSFGLLGPVEIRSAAQPLRVGGPQVQAILAALLLEANRVVTIDRLVDAVWGALPPDAARVQVQNRVGGLRRLLRGAGEADPIETHGTGYRIRVGSDCLDVDRFEALVRDAAVRIRHADRVGAAAALETALALWRGSALDGLRTPRLQAVAQRLEESRLTARESVIDLKLELSGSRAGQVGDDQHGVIGELMELVSEHPFRERLTAQLMTALFRAGRQQEALEEFDRLRRRLATELGIDPGRQLRQVHSDILHGQCSIRLPVQPGGTDTGSNWARWSRPRGRDNRSSRW